MMASLTNRPSGVKVHTTTGTRGNVTLLTNSSYFNVYRDLRSTDKKVLDVIMQLVSADTNHIIVAGDTASEIRSRTKYSASTVRHSVSRLKQSNLLNKLQLPSEFILNPMFAYKGSKAKVWKFLLSVEYKGNVPREVKGVSFEEE